MGALGTAWMASKTALLYTNPGVFAIGGIVMTLAGLIGAQYVQPTQSTEIVNGNQIYKTTNSPFRLALYGIGMAGLGLSGAPLITYASMLNPSIVPTCMAITAAIFGGASLVAYNTPSEKMAKIGPILGGSILGLLGLQLDGLLSHLIVGPNLLSTLLFRADNYLGILLFSGFIAYDTHVAVQNYEAGNADHLAMSIQLLLDVWNIFIRLLSIFSNRD